MTRGQLAKEAGVNSETLRYYEQRQLVPEPPRTDSGYRQYPKNTVARIRFIKRAQELGFSLSEISELLTLRVDPSRTCVDVKDRTDAKISEIKSKIRSLKRIERALTRLSEACTGSGPTSECPILDAIATTP